MGRFRCTILTLFPLVLHRVEISKEDDLSADSDSDTMDVDTVSHDGEEKNFGAKQTTAGKASTKGTSGFVVPEPLPHFAVSYVRAREGNYFV